MSSTSVVDKLVVRRVIAAPAENVFDAWLDADAMTAWITPKPSRKAEVTLDARVGGQFKIVMHGEHGTVPHHGVYQVIDRPRRLVFTWNSPFAGEHGSLVTVEFVARPGGTEVVLTHEKLPSESMVGPHREGWTAVLDNLDKQLAR